MEFKKGFKIKPKRITPTGEVIFTDGTNDTFANEVTCRAYGYKFDKKDGICYAFKYPRDLYKSNKSQTSRVEGVENEIEDGTENTIVTGKENKTKGDNQNSLIIGQNNIIENGVSNCLVAGTFAVAKNKGEFVLGGGTFLETADIEEERVAIFQTSFILMNTVTIGTQSNSAMVQRTGDIDFTDTNLDVSNYIQQIAGSIQIFEIDVIALQFGGTDAVVGRFDQFKIEGAYKTGSDGAQDSLTQSTTYKINNSDLTNPVLADSPRAGGITVQCVGKSNTSIEWYINVKMMTCKTSIDF
jgi:hypothetical protein|tara:strand:- start:68 stop:961 length:894 start_codon:yes stop_codon:yes gene_type:complete